LYKPLPKKPSLRDIEGNGEAIFAVMKASRGVGRYSAFILKHAILRFYTKHHLFPTGISEDMSIIDTWALRQGRALQRLVTWISDGVKS